MGVRKPVRVRLSQRITCGSFGERYYTRADMYKRGTLKRFFPPFDLDYSCVHSG